MKLTNVSRILRIVWGVIFLGGGIAGIIIFFNQKDYLTGGVCIVAVMLGIIYLYYAITGKKGFGRI